MKAYNKYKDSGIEWLGEIPEHWEVFPLKRVVDEKITDGPHETPEFLSEGIPFISAEAIQDGYINFSKARGFISKEEDVRFSLKCKPRNNDIFIVKSGSTTGKIGYVDNDVDFNIWSPLALVRCNKKNESRYIYHFLKSDLFQAQVQFSWSFGTQPNIGMNVLENLKITISPLSEQYVIATFLDKKTLEIDKLIENKEKLIALYEEEKQAIINRAVTKGINPHVKMKYSGIEWLGEIPEHWEVKKLKYVLLSKRGALKTGPFGSQLKTSDLNPDGNFKVYTQRNVLDNDFEKGEDHIDDITFAMLKDFEVLPKDILVTSRGSIGKCAVFPLGQRRGVLHPCLIRIQIDDKKLIARWIVNYFNMTSYFLENVKLESNSTVIDVIYGYTLKEIAIPVPFLSEQSIIVAYIEKECSRLDTIIEKFKKQIELFKEYRKTLISAAVTGKIDVREE